MTGILLFAFGLRLFAYTTQELGLDGHLSVGLALLPTERLLDFLTRDVHPPLYYLVLKGWLAVAGVSFLTARWLSLAAGLLSLAMLYRLGARLGGPRGALVALLLLSLSPAHIAASATARDFGLGFFLSVSTLVVWHELWRVGGARRRRWLLGALGLLSVLAVATWYLHGIFVVVQVVDLVLRRRDRRGPLLALALAMAVQLPWLVLAGPPLLAKLLGGVTVSGEPPSPAAIALVAQRIGYALAGSAPEPIPTDFGALSWALLVLVGLLWASHDGGPRMRWALLATGGLTLGGTAIYGLTSVWAEPSLLGRYGLVLLPWAFLAQSWALAATSRVRPQGDAFGKRAPTRRPMVAGSVVLVSVVLGAQVVDFRVLIGNAIDWNQEPLVAIVEADGQPGDAVVFTDHARYGLYRLRGRSALPSESVHFAGSAFLRDDVPGEVESLLGELLGRNQRIWLAYDRPAHSESLAEVERRLLVDRFLVRRDEHGPTVVELFAPVADLESHSSQWRFGDRIDLIGWAVAPSTRPGDQVFVELRWQVLRAPGADYKVFAHLVDSEGERIAQHDGVPMLGLRPTTEWKAGDTIVDRFAVRVPPTARPGEYRVLVGLYRGEERLRLEDGGDHVIVGPTRIDAPRQ